MAILDGMTHSTKRVTRFASLVTLLPVNLSMHDSSSSFLLFLLRVDFFHSMSNDARGFK